MDATNTLVKNYLEEGQIEKKAIRDGFGDGLLLAAEQNENIVGLCADLTESVRMEQFAKKFPERYFEIGVAEQNMMGIAAGLGISGKIPFAASYAAFSPGRNWDQLRVSVAYSKSNVKIASSHAGITVGEDGATHQGMEDIAITRVLPNMTVIVPADYEEARKATLAAAEFVGPVYIRLARPKAPVFTTRKTPFTIGLANVLRTGSNVTIIASGIMVYEALQAAEQLAQAGISAEVINLHTIKMIDQESILKSVSKTKCVVTAEEHQISGGVGSAVAEVLAKNLPVPMEMVGMPNSFGESGKPQELLEKYGMTRINIAHAAQKVLERKS